MRPSAQLALLTAGLLFAASAAADPVSGYLKLSNQWDATPSDSVATQLGHRYYSDSHADLRLIWAPQAGPWSALVHGQLLADQGGEVVLTHALEQTYPQFTPYDPDSTSALHLSHVLTDSSDTRIVSRFDRFYLGYATDHLILRAGRQAITWGTGQIFHPMDLFDPFSPIATDTEYKTGVDMLYGQWLFNDGSDLQGLIVPRRDPVSGELRKDQGSVALHYQRNIGELQFAWMLARDRQDNVAGFSLGGPAGSAAWSTTVVPEFSSGGVRHASVVANFTEARTWNGRPATVLFEYYYNGFGETGSDYTLNDLSAQQMERLTRGQVFVTGRHYLATGLTVDWTPLLKLQATLIVNARDHSALLLPDARYSLGENTELVFIGQLPLGSHGSEFGGLQLYAGGPVLSAAPSQFYVRLAQYF